MAERTYEQIMQGVRKAHEAGDKDAARRLAAIARKLKDSESKPEPEQEKKGMGPLGRLARGYVGAAETGLSIAGGVTGSILGGLAGIGDALWSGDSKSAADTVGSVQDALTYRPRTEAGQSFMEGIGNTVGKAGEYYDEKTDEYLGTPTLNATGSPLLATAAKMAPDIALEAVGLGNVRRAGTAARAAGRYTVPDRPVRELPAGAPSGPKGLSAAETGAIDQRIANAEQFGIDLTRGQASRDVVQQRAESLAAGSERGAPLRERFDQQNAAIIEDVDRLADSNAEIAGDVRMGLDEYETGAATRSALERARDASKGRVDEAYERARTGPEAVEIVDTDKINELMIDEDFIEYGFNHQTEGAYKGIKSYMERAGLIDETTGSLRRMDALELEKLRQQVNSRIDWQNPQQRRMGRELVESIDDAMDEAGESFKAARAERKRHASQFEENEMVSQILGMKGKTSRARVADEQIARRVTNLPVDEIKKVRDVLIQGGDEGRAAWYNLKNQVIEGIKKKGFNENKRNAAGDPTVNAGKLSDAIDAIGDEKLTMLFGKQQATRLRELAEVARTVGQPIAGAVNYSNTASHLGAILDRFSSIADSVSGIPIAGPAIRQGRKYLEGRKLDSEINQALDARGMLSGGL